MDLADSKGVLALVQFANLCKKIINQPNEIKDWADFSSKIKYFKECLKEKGLSVIIIFHAYGGLNLFLTFAINELQEKSGIIKQKFPNENDRKNLLTILSSILNLIFKSSYDCFLSRQKLLAQNMPSSKKLESYTILFKKAEKTIQLDKEQNESIFKELLDKIQQINNIGQAQEKRKKLNQFLLGRLLLEKTDHPFDQAALNWIKKTVELMQHEKEELVCCRVIFEHKSTSALGKFSETANQQFKDYRWPLENQSIKFHLTKTVIGFLNTTGGIIYVGLREDKSKMIEVKGIKLNAQQKIDFLYFIHDDIMKGVYPKQPDRKKYQEDIAKDPNKETQYRKQIKKEFESNDKKSEYRINKYVHVDFMDIYDKDTFLNSKEEDCGLYIARIKIKLGDSRELYHVVNHQKNIPEAYCREEKSVKKKSLKDFYDIFYERMKNSNPYNGSEKIQQHGNCRFNARCNE